MKMLEVGTKVVILDSEVARQSETVGKEGVIERISGIPYPYGVRWGNDERWGWFTEKEIEAINNKEEMRGVTVNSTVEKVETQRTVNYSTHKVIFNKPAVIVILGTGEKGVAKCLPTDVYDEEKGYQLALARAKYKKLIKDRNKKHKIWSTAYAAVMEADKEINKLIGTM